MAAAGLQEEASSLLAKSKALLNEDRIPSIPKRSPLAPRISSNRSSPSPRSSQARRTRIDEIPISSNGASHSNLFQRPHSMPLAQPRGSMDGRGAVDMHFVERGGLVGLPWSSLTKSLVEEIEEVSLPRFSAYSKSRCHAAADAGSCDDESVPAGRHFLSNALDRVTLPAKRFDYLPGTATWGFEVNMPSTKMPPGTSSTRAWLNDARPASYPQHQRPARNTAATADSADELIRRIHGIGAPTDEDTWEEDSEGDLNVGAVASRHEAPPRVLDADRLPLSHSSDRAGTEKKLRGSESIRLRTCDMSSVFGWSWFGKADK